MSNAACACWCGEGVKEQNRECREIERQQRELNPKSSALVNPHDGEAEASRDETFDVKSPKKGDGILNNCVDHQK